MDGNGKLDELCINTIRFLAVDAVEKANSGHPGMPMGAAPMAYILWTKYMKYNPSNPEWFDRDRFVLSAGHGSMLLYSLLHLTGYDLSLDQIKQFRQWGSIAPGHPERIHTPGVEVTTGPLGQGFGNGVGMAVAETNLAARYNRPGHEIINHYTYAIVSDGDIMEGVSAEAASIAGHLKLGKLIYFYDANRISLAASTNLTLTEDVAKRFDAYGWHTETIDDGNDLELMSKAVDKARKEKGRPSLIIVHTHIGYGSPNMQDTFEAHGKPLGKDEVKRTKENLNWPTDKEFYIPPDAERHFRKALERGTAYENDWNSRFDDYRREFPELAEELDQLIEGVLPQDWNKDIPVFSPDEGEMATRTASQKILNAIAPNLPALIGGSADLAPSTKTLMKGLGDFEPPQYAEGDTQGSEGELNYSGRNLHFGVREHAMGSMINGMAAHGGVLPFGGTFLIFSDYMRPTIRLASLMKLPVKYVFTHDSIGVGEDGPTHQPVEQLASLRAIPGLVVIRPADANETAEAWRIAVESRDNPVAVICTRQKLPVLDRELLESAAGVRRGAYILKDPPGGQPDVILIASGSEIILALRAQEALLHRNINARVVSMPSWELFDRQSKEYRESVLPDEIEVRLAIEAGSPVGWHKYTGSDGDVIGVEHFGASAPGPKIMEEYGFNTDNICSRVMALLGRRERVQ